MSKFLRVIFILIACAVSLAPALALAGDSLPTTESKENRKFEGQGALNATDFFRWLQEHQILGTGFVGTGYNVVMHDGETDHYLNLSVETRLYSRRADRAQALGGIEKAAEKELAKLKGELREEELALAVCKRTYPTDRYRCDDLFARRLQQEIAKIERDPFSADNTGGGEGNEWWDDILFLPVETHVRVRLDEEQKADVRDLRVGLFRFMNDNGLNIQALSYLVKNNDLGMGRLKGFELAELAISEAVFVEGVDFIELVFKGTASIGYADMRLNGDTIPNAAATAGIDRENNISGSYVTAGGSVGLRIARKVVVSVFGGMEQIVDYTDEAAADAESPKKVSNRYRNRYFGVGVRYTPVKGVSLHGYVRRDEYEVSAELQRKGDSGGPLGKASETRKATSAGVDLEVRW